MPHANGSITPAAHLEAAAAATIGVPPVYVLDNGTRPTQWWPLVRCVKNPRLLERLWEHCANRVWQVAYGLTLSTEDAIRLEMKYKAIGDSTRPPVNRLCTSSALGTTAHTPCGGFRRGNGVGAGVNLDAGKVSAVHGEACFG